MAKEKKDDELANNFDLPSEGQANTGGVVENNAPVGVGPVANFEIMANQKNAHSAVWIFTCFFCCNWA